LIPVTPWAVDGGEATIWAPTDTTASLTDDLGSRRRVSAIAVHWTDARPGSSRIETSLDGTTWTSVAPGAAGDLHNTIAARYVRVTLTRAADADRTGIRELVVTGK
jgi:hypothetical protein